MRHINLRIKPKLSPAEEYIQGVLDIATVTKTNTTSIRHDIQNYTFINRYRYC